MFSPSTWQTAAHFFRVSSITARCKCLSGASWWRCLVFPRTPENLLCFVIVDLVLSVIRRCPPTTVSIPSHLGHPHSRVSPLGSPILSHLSWAGWRPPAGNAFCLFTPKPTNLQPFVPALPPTSLFTQLLSSMNSLSHSRHRAHEVFRKTNLVTPVLKTHN